MTLFTEKRLFYSLHCKSNVREVSNNNIVNPMAATDTL